MDVKVSQVSRAAAFPQATELPPRVVGRFGDSKEGPTLIVFGGIHGNEPAGYTALCELFERLEQSPIEVHGTLIGLVGNRQALAEGVRYIELDLNRFWVSEAVRRLQVPGERTNELEEAREIYLETEKILGEAGGEVFALDIHTTSGPSPAFVVYDDSIQNRELALDLEVPRVLGIEEELEGTLMDYLNSRGVRTAAFEAGQHDDRVSVDQADAAIWVAMRSSGVLGDGYEAEVEAARERLSAAAGGLPTLFEVKYRHVVKPDAGFRMNSGLRGFQVVTEGDEVAVESGKPVLAPQSGRLLMPLYQAQGEDGYFVIRPVWTPWLALSARLRRFGLERFVHWLPGVRRLDGSGREIQVNVRVARWLPLDFFHLLGYRKMAQSGKYLRLRRRDNGNGPAALPSASS